MTPDFGGHSDDSHSALLLNLPVGVAFQEIILDDAGRPVDFVYQEMNHLFAELVGIDRSQALGKRATEVIPRFKESSIDWFDLFFHAAPWLALLAKATATATATVSGLDH